MRDIDLAQGKYLQHWEIIEQENMINVLDKKLLIKDGSIVVNLGGWPTMAFLRELESHGFDVIHHHSDDFTGMPLLHKVVILKDQAELNYFKLLHGDHNYRWAVQI